MSDAKEPWDWVKYATTDEVNLMVMAQGPTPRGQASHGATLARLKKRCLKRWRRRGCPPSEPPAVITKVEVDTSKMVVTFDTDAAEMPEKEA